MYFFNGFVDEKSPKISWGVTCYLLVDDRHSSCRLNQFATSSYFEIRCCVPPLCVSSCQLSHLPWDKQWNLCFQCTRPKFWPNHHTRVYYAFRDLGFFTIYRLVIVHLKKKTCTWVSVVGFTSITLLLEFFHV